MHLIGLVLGWSSAARKNFVVLSHSFKNFHVWLSKSFKNFNLRLLTNDQKDIEILYSGTL